MNPPQNLSELYPPEWLNPASLEGEIKTITITAFEVRKFDRSKEPDEWRVVLSFKETPLRLICNKTQAEAIAARTRSEAFPDWIGHQITVKPGLANNRKATIIVTAVSPPRPPTVKPQPPTPPPNSHPATRPDRIAITAQPEPETAVADVGIFDYTYNNGMTVYQEDQKVFNQYRRAHQEKAPTDKRSMDNWHVGYKRRMAGDSTA